MLPSYAAKVNFFLNFSIFIGNSNFLTDILRTKNPNIRLSVLTLKRLERVLD